MRKGLFFLTASLILINCTEDNLPMNPFDIIDYTDPSFLIDTVSSTSFVRIHKDILEPSCNVMGCHDGSFEPDFRTVESSYSTLVYHPITKNNLAEDFMYRVVPKDTTFSVLHERLTNCCFVNENDRMPQDNIGNSLPQESLDNISYWILDGAKSITGDILSEPNSLPNIKYFYVTNTTYDSTYSENREENLFYKPFLMPKNEVVNFVIRVNDDHTNSADMLVNELSFSKNLDDFTNAINVTALIFDQTYKVWIIPVNTAVFEGGETYYIRYTINDGDHSDNMTYPNNDVLDIYKSMWSFTLE